MLIIAYQQTKEVFFGESKYKRDWSPYHRGFFRLMARNLGTTLTEVRNIKKKLEPPGK